MTKNLVDAVKQHFWAKCQLEHEYHLTEQDQVALEDIIISFETNPDHSLIIEYIECFGADKDLKDFLEGCLKESVIVEKIRNCK